MRQVVWWKFTGVPEILAATIIREVNASIIALKMEAADSCETSVDLYQNAWRSNTDDSHLESERDPRAVL